MARGLIVLFFLVDFFFGTTLAAQQDWTFDRYQPILTRQPFGRPPPPAPPPTPPAQPPSPPKIPFTQNLRLTSLTFRGGTYRAGIVDASGQSGQKFYYVFLGESEGDISFIDVDPATDRVLLEMKGDKEWLGMSSGAPGSGAPIAPVGRRALPGVPSVRGEGASIQPAAPSAIVSYREQLAARAAEREKQRQEERERLRQMTQEEVNKKLQEYQMELIRAEGEAGPPIPGVVLTPEMDRQLVEEGVLPPLDTAVTP